MDRKTIIVDEELHNQMIAMLVESIDWHRGDKWRNSESGIERDRWEQRSRQLDALLGKAKATQP